VADRNDVLQMAAYRKIDEMHSIVRLRYGAGLADLGMQPRQIGIGICRA